jgi:sugar lactone lactonase YvrE
MFKLKNTIGSNRSLCNLMFGSAIFLNLILTGCGGGGGSGEAASSTQTPPPPPPPVASGPSITLYAGALGGAGNADGFPGRLSRPDSVAVDASNNIYVGDEGNCNIRKLTSAGLTVFMGDRSCRPYASDGSITQSTFTAFPIFADRAGTLYIAEPDKPISRLALDGTLTALPVIARQFARYAIDTDGTIFEPDASVGVIYKYDKSGSRTVFASGLGPSSFFGSIALGSDGTIFVADYNAHLIRKINRAGQVTTLAGSGVPGSADGIGISAQFNNPSEIALDVSGNIYVGDGANYTIRKITPNGVVSTLAGTAGLRGAADGTGAAARFLSVGTMTVDRSGAVIVADLLSNTIRRVSQNGVVTTIAGVPPNTGSNDGSLLASRFNSPSGLARDSAGNIYVADTLNATVRKLSASGDVITFAGKIGEIAPLQGTAIAGRFYRPHSISLDQQGSVYVADYARITKISSTGDAKLFVEADGFFKFTRTFQSLTFDSQSRLYAVSARLPSGSTLSSISEMGLVTPLACTANCPYQAITGDKNGNIVGTSSRYISRVGADGTATIIAGSDPKFAYLGGWKDGAAADALFSDNMRSLAVDNNGNIFVCDTGNHIIRKITPSGMVTTIAGKAGIAGTTVGPLPGLLNSPSGIVIDNAGNLYVTTEDAVVKITLS